MHKVGNINNDINANFYKKKFGGHMSFYGATDTPILDFW